MKGVNEDEVDKGRGKSSVNGSISEAQGRMKNVCSYMLRTCKYKNEREDKREREGVTRDHRAVS